MTSCLDIDAYNEKWELTTTNQIRSTNSNLCLDYEDLNPQDNIFVRKCDKNSETQKWIIVH